MKFFTCRYALPVFLLFFMSGVLAQPASKKDKAIICLTYDDGLESHLSTVVPQLDSFQFKATFFLNAIKGSAELIGQPSPQLSGWKSAAQNGHELGNHTLFHPCPQQLGWPKEVAIESYSTEKIMQEVRAVDMILDLIDSRTDARSFAYPCNNTVVDGKDYSNALKKSGLILYGRSGGDSNSVIKNFENLNAMQVPSWLVAEGTTLQQLVAFAQKAKASSGMAVYQFHGVGAAFFKISTETHAQFLRYLKENEQHYQVLNFSAAMKQILTK